MSHGQTRTHKTHHGPDLGEATTFPLYIIFCGWPWDQHPNGIFSWDSQAWVPKFSQLGLPRLWGPITLRANLRLRRGLKQSFSPRWELSNDIWSASIQWVLTPEIALWRFRSPFGTLIPKMGVHLGMWGSFPHTLLHSREHEMWLPGFLLGPHPCKPLPWSRDQG
jgi:hypothetical protein